MSKINYLFKKFSPVHTAVIWEANQIIEDYAAQGYELTLRQLYYQFISRESFPDSWRDKVTGSKNNERSYKKLGNIISDARLAGLIDWEAITDRTRQLKSWSLYDNLPDFLRTMKWRFAYNVWKDQPVYIEVWVEKEALAQVIEKACRHLYVPHCSCKGYMSQSAMWRSAVRFQNRKEEGKEGHLIYLGDHDPSGMDMSRDIGDRQDLFLSGVTTHRIALNWDQVEQYAPPPNPTKVTDSRAQGYIDEYGLDCWELDALEPSVLDLLIQDKISSLIDPQLMAQAHGQYLEEELDRIIKEI